MSKILFPTAPEPRIHWIAVVYDCISALVAKRCGYRSVLLRAQDAAQSLYGRAVPSLPLDTWLHLLSNLHLAEERTIYVSFDRAWARDGDDLAYVLGRLRRAGAQGVFLRGNAGDSFWLEAAEAATACGLHTVLESDALSLRDRQADRARALSAAGTLFLFTEGAEALSDLPESVRERLVYHVDVARPVPAKALLQQHIAWGLVDFAVPGTRYGLQLYAEHTVRDRNTVFHDQHDFDGRLNGHDYHEIFDFGERWVAREGAFMAREQELDL